MADTYMKVSAQTLDCPICLSLFTVPKSLSCTHTFCEDCLLRLLRSQSDESKLRCPVCQKKTSVPSGGVVGLQTNIPLNTLVEDVKNREQICTNCNRGEKSPAVSYCQQCGKYMCDSCQKTHSEWKGFSEHRVCDMSDVLAGKGSLTRRKCSKHPVEDEDNFCVNCRKYVCFKCGVMEHERKAKHEVIQCSEHEEKIQKRIESMMLRASSKKENITKYVDYIRKQQQKLKVVCSRLTDDVDKSYNESVEQLQQRKEELKEEIKKNIDKLETKLVSMVESSERQITHVDAASELVGKGIKTPIEMEALTAHDTLCQKLEAILELEDPDYAQPENAMERGEKLRFWRNDESANLQMGRLRDDFKTAWEFDQKIPLTNQNSMQDMVPTPDGNMAVACNPGGIELYTSDGHLLKTVLEDTPVLGLGFLSDGRYVVREVSNNISLHTPEGEKLDVKFKVISDTDGGPGGVAVDKNDLIYVGYKKALRIQIFKETGGKAIKVIQCNSFEPLRLFPMTSKGMFLVKNGNSSVVVIDDSGTVKQCISKDPSIHCYPSVYDQDDVIVCWMKYTEGTLTIEHYTSDLKHIRTLASAEEAKNSKRKWLVLRAFQSGEIALCTTSNLCIYAQHEVYE